MAVPYARAMSRRLHRTIRRAVAALHDDVIARDGVKNTDDLTTEARLWEIAGDHHLAALLRADRDAGRPNPTRITRHPPTGTRR